MTSAKGPVRDEDDLLTMLADAGLVTSAGSTAPGVFVGVGDDAAVLAATAQCVVSTDLMMEHHDFRLDWSTAELIGAKSCAQNVADIAAMGANPTALVVSLVVPGDINRAWVYDLYVGLNRAGVPVVGGDLTVGSPIIISVTAVGTLHGRRPVLRSGAQPGDVAMVAGLLGWSAAGLWLLRNPDRAEALSGHSLAAIADRARNLHLAPTPPVWAGPQAAEAGARSMLDISDGLLRDAARIASASEVDIDVDRDQLRSYPGVRELHELGDAVGANAWEWILAGGEDHGLLTTWKSNDVPRAVGIGFEPIGVVGSASAEPTVTVDAQKWVGRTGWDHFA